MSQFKIFNNTKFILNKKGLCPRYRKLECCWSTCRPTTNRGPHRVNNNNNNNNLNNNNNKCINNNKKKINIFFLL